MKFLKPVCIGNAATRNGCTCPPCVREEALHQARLAEFLVAASARAAADKVWEDRLDAAESPEEEDRIWAEWQAAEPARAA